MKKETKGSFLSLALIAFLGLGMELVLVMVEQGIYGNGMREYSMLQQIVHWLITSLIWGGFAWYLHVASKKLKFDYMKQTEQPERKKFILVCIIALLSIVEMTISWGGFKPWIELTRLGAVKFVFQYIYYLFETSLYLLIVIFGQKYGEEVFHKSGIPYGGIVLALTWGMIHIGTQGLMAGIETIIFSVFFGIIYLLLNRNVKWSYFFLALIFLL